MGLNLVTSNPMQVLWFVAGAASGAGADLLLRSNSVINDDFNNFFTDGLGSHTLLDTLYFVEAIFEPVVVGLVSGALAATLYTAAGACYGHSHSA